MMKLGTSLFFIFNFQLIYGWNDSYEKSDDQHVLTVFLPLLGIAILACAGGCCYMEKKRKERLKRGGTGVDTDDESDAESVISTSTVRSRPFLLPSTTTGRISRTGSRPGSMRSYRSNYDQTEKPPSYLYEKDSQGGLHMTAHEPDEISFYGGSVRSSVRDPMERGGFDNQALQRSSSMIDVRGGRRGMQDPARGRPQIRRSQSVIGFNDDPRGGYNSAAEQPSPTPSNWSVRTAPQVDYRRAPSSTSGHGGGGRPPQFSTNQLKRSMSQPDLRGGRGGATMTYPQGILKRTASTSGLDGDAARYYLGKTNNSSDSGVKDLYYQQELGTRGYDRYEEYSDKMNNHRGDPYAAQRRPASMVGYGTYSNAGYGGYEDTNQLYGGYSTRPPRQVQQQQQQQQPRAHHQHQLPRRQPQQQQHPANYGTMPPHYQPHYSMSEYGNYEAYNYRRRPEVAGGRAAYNTKPSNSRMHDPYSYRGY